MASHLASLSGGGEQHPLAAILTLRHHRAHHDADQQQHAPPGACPLTVVEDTLACSADFLLVQAITAFLGKSQPARPLAAVDGAAPAPPPADQHPAVVLCTFRQPALHYTHIARKWGVSLPSLQRSGSLYLIDDLLTCERATSSPSSDSAPSFQTQLDTWFQVGDAATLQPSPLHAFISHLQQLRSRHSSLLLLVDDLQYLFLHSAAGEMEVLDALVALQMSLAAADAAASPVPARSSVVAPHTTFSVDAASPSAASAPSCAAALPSGLVLVAHGDVPVSPVLSLLRRRASTFIKLSALQTGYTREISGVLSVQHHDCDTDYWTPTQRSHYHLGDSHVKISVPGHSTSTLQQ